MEPCEARIADPQWSGARVRVDVQSEVRVSPELNTGKGVGHNVVVYHYWRLSCPHCLMNGGLHIIDNPVKFGELDRLKREFAKNHDEYQDRVAAKQG